MMLLKQKQKVVKIQTNNKMTMQLNNKLYRIKIKIIKSYSKIVLNRNMFIVILKFNFIIFFNIVNKNYKNN